jgi:hypothetical protein
LKYTSKTLALSAFAVACAIALPAVAAQLSNDARSAIPKDVQQLIAVDYRAMQNSSAAMDLKNRVLPPELKQLEEALKNSGLNANHDVDELAFASFRVGGLEGTRIVGMQAVDTQAVWSVLDQEGTQFMMHSVLGQASQVTDYDTVKKRLLGSRYSMDFSNGVKFNLAVETPDAFTAGTMASLLNAAALYKKMSGTPSEKQAIENTTVRSNADNLEVNFSASDSQFVSLLQSPLFQAVVR